jgi:predicted GIY-YIG superfamily endonuclease
MAAHNSGNSKHTAKYRPWKLINYHAFADKRKAQEFEHYLKTGSGQAFANRRFW